jgi:NADP-dependent 3-hydroxy acid dehydrogenase YdfG
LIGRTAATLDETKSKLSGDAQISTFVTDITDEIAMEKIAQTVGIWDVAVLNAGYISTPSPVAKADIGDYWKAYEVWPTLSLLLIQTNISFHRRPTSSP